MNDVTYVRCSGCSGAVLATGPQPPVCPKCGRPVRGGRGVEFPQEPIHPPKQRDVNVPRNLKPGLLQAQLPKPLVVLVVTVVIAFSLWLVSGITGVGKEYRDQIKGTVMGWVERLQGVKAPEGG